MFVHLRLHTEFSVVDGTNRVDEIVKAAASRWPAGAGHHRPEQPVWRHQVLQGSPRQGVKPLIGAEMMVQGLAKDPTQLSRMVLLVQNSQGYLNLCELLARAWTQNVVKAQAVCKPAWLQELGEGLIVLSGAQAGPVGQALVQGDARAATEVALQLASLFPHRFYLELQRAGRVDDEAHVAAACSWPRGLKLPVVATHPVQFTAGRRLRGARGARVHFRRRNPGQPAARAQVHARAVFQVGAQMQALFADVPSAIANTVEIARRCNLTLELGKPRLPDFPTPNGMPIESTSALRRTRA
jgi:DNA polymerase-3 subunit alpha